MQTANNQRGVVLIVTLLMLVVITLLGLTSVNSSTVNLRIVENMRTSQEQESAAQQAIEVMISDANNFYSPQTRTDIFSGYQVTVDAPGCLWTQPTPGNSARVEGSQDVVVPEITYWEYTACVGGHASCFTQGVRMRMLAGRCEPSVTYTE